MSRINCHIPFDACGKRREDKKKPQDATVLKMCTANNKNVHCRYNIF